MRLLATLTLVVLAAPVGAKDPLRFIPAEAGAVLRIDKPRALIEAVTNHDLAKQAQHLQIVRDFLDSADARRFFQLVAYYERDLGAAWPDLLDKLAGGGIAVGFQKLEGDGPVLFVIQGTDEATVAKFLDLAFKVIEEEAERQGSKERLVRKKYQGVECVQIGPDFKVARVGDAILAANKDQALKAGLDAWAGSGKNTTFASSSGPKDVAKILPPNPAAWLWVNLVPVKASPEAKNVLTTPRNDVVQTVLFADLLDVARRSDFLAVGVYHNAGDFNLAVRMPAGRDGMAADVEIHAPKDPNVGGTLPLLEPKGVLFSHSFYLDLDPIYAKRDAILPAQVSKDFVEGEKQISRFLLGTTLPKYLSQTGVHHRVVVAPPEKVEGYKTQPGQRLPSFAVVTSMRDPGFVKTTTSIVRAVALAAGQNNVSLRSWEEEIAGLPAFGYSFPEKGKFPDDPEGLRFNYQPTVVVVKDQMVFASNKGLAKELIGLIQKEDRSKVSAATMQTRVYASGLGEYANIAPDQTLAATILSQALPVGEAKKQTDALLAFLQKLGTAGATWELAPNEFRLDVRWKAGK
jgi:hypothetical protein